MAQRAPVLPGPGSYRLLAWVARLGIAGIEPARLALGVSQAVAYSHVARLVDAGFVSRAWVGDGGGGVVAVTRAGAREAHERGTSAAVVPRSAAPRSLRHGRAVSWAAALLGLRDRAWVAERELHTAPAQWHVPVYWPSRRGTHRPDLGALVDGRRIAIEVELSAKAPRRLRAIVAGYEAAIADGQLAGVVYVCDRADVLAGVRRAAGHAGLSSQRFRTRTLADVQREVRERASARRHRVARRVPARRRVSERERRRPNPSSSPVSSLERCWAL